MTLQEFFEKWNGKYLEVAGTVNAQYQCVDLANGYIRDVLGLPIIEWTNAVDFPLRASKNYDFIQKTSTNIPQEGDLVIWNKNVGGGAGHIAIFVEGNANKFISFDQNWPTGSPCHFQEHTYTNVVGWLRAKRQSGIIEEMEWTDQTRIPLLDNKEIQAIRSELADLRRDNAIYLSKIQSLETELAKKPLEITKEVIVYQNEPITFKLVLKVILQWLKNVLNGGEVAKD